VLLGKEGLRLQNSSKDDGKSTVLRSLVRIAVLSNAYAFVSTLLLICVLTDGHIVFDGCIMFDCSIDSSME